MQVLNPNHIFSFIAAPFTLIPATLLIIYYYRTHIFDFLLFGGFLITGFFTLLTDALADIYGTLILYQLHSISIDSATLLLFLHVIRIHWSKPPKKVLFLGVGWFTILLVMTFMWELMIQPERITVLFIEMPRAHSTYFPNGAGLMLADGIMLFGTAYRFLGDIFTVLVIGFLLWTYATVTIALPTNPIIRAKKLWIAVWLCLFIQTISRLPWMFYTDAINIFLVIGGLIACYITIFIPEATLISHSQIARASKLYKIFEEELIPIKRDVIGPASLFAYISTLREDEDFKEIMRSKEYN